MKPSLFFSSLAAALFLAPVLATAQPQDTPANRPDPGQPGGQFRWAGGGQGPGHPGAGPETMPQRRSMMADLGLTDVQKADLLKVRETAQRDRLRKSTDFKIASLDLRSLMRVDKVDDKAIAAKLAEIQAAQGALLKVRVDQALAMKRILTPEQQKKMSEMRGQRVRTHRTMRQGRRMGQPMGRPMGGDDLDDMDGLDDLDDLGPEGPIVH